ncbi:MAG: Gx transporter family protein [Tissierellia bacterium]|nr:Gx transporter family protein [Tissierellia bacterium]
MKKYIYLGILTTFSLVLSLFEQMINLSIMIPGAKIGLSNIIILSIIALYSMKDGLFVALLKSFLLMLLTGSVTGFFYSVSGGIISVLVMGLAYEYFRKYLSFIGISVLGSISHLLSQMVVARYVLGTNKIFVYFPILTMVGIPTGIVVGIMAHFLTKHLRNLLKAGIH